MNIPTQPELWKRIQKLVSGESKYIVHNKKKIMGPNDGTGFKKHPSAYSNGWAVKLYNELGGGWKTSKTASIAVRVADLGEWFKEKWVAIDTQGNIIGPCGQSKNRPKETKKGQDPLKCLPLSQAIAMKPKDLKGAARRKKRLEKRSPDSKKPVHAPTYES